MEYVGNFMEMSFYARITSIGSTLNHISSVDERVAMLNPLEDSSIVIHTAEWNKRVYP